MEITVGARNSRLSQEQVFEVWREITVFHQNVRFHPIWTITGGDKDRVTPLWKVFKTDFFTQEIDEKLLREEIRIAIHSAKDLPSPLPKGLSLIALTKGIDSRDSLVIHPKTSFAELPPNARVGSSSKRRSAAMKKLRADLLAVDIRGTIDERLELVYTGVVDAVIIAEAALIRLKLTYLHRIFLDHETDPLQGKLAVIARTDDQEMFSLFLPIDTRKRVAVVGPSVPQYLKNDHSTAVIHSPLIQLKTIPVCINQLESLYTTNGVILTSKHAASFFHKALQGFTLSAAHLKFFCVGQETAAATQTLFSDSEILTARDATQEGVVDLILSHRPQHLFWPRSTHARRHLPEALEKAGISITELPLYTPVSSSTPFSFEGIDSIFFTCPSSVDTFFDVIEKSQWKRISMQAIGPVTQARLVKRRSYNEAI
jgi:hydroxymethylbilane synthase